MVLCVFDKSRVDYILARGPNGSNSSNWLKPGPGFISVAVLFTLVAWLIGFGSVSGD